MGQGLSGAEGRAGRGGVGCLAGVKRRRMRPEKRSKSNPSVLFLTQTQPPPKSLLPEFPLTVSSHPKAVDITGPRRCPLGPDASTGALAE